jgi:hypothetical protein
MSIERIQQFFAARRESVIVHAAVKLREGKLHANTTGFLCLSPSFIGYFRDSGELLHAIESDALFQHAMNPQQPNATPLLKISLHGQDITKDGPLSGTTFEFLGTRAWELQKRTSDCVVDMIRAHAHAKEEEKQTALARHEERASRISTGAAAATSSRVSGPNLVHQALLRDPDVKVLFDELVGRGVMTSNEFWELREQSVVAERTSSRFQQKGLPTSLPAAGIGGRTRVSDKQITLTSTEQEQILSAQPRIRKAFERKVPFEMTKEDFWVAYFRALNFWQHEMTHSDTATISTQQSDQQFMSLHEASERHFTKTSSLVKDKLSGMIDPDVDLTADDDEVSFQSHGAYGVGNVSDGELLVDSEFARTRQHQQATGLLRRFNRVSSVTVRAAAGEGALAAELASDVEDDDDIADISSRPRVVLRSSLSDLEADPERPVAPLAISDPHVYFAGRVKVEDDVKQEGNGYVVERQFAPSVFSSLEREMTQIRTRSLAPTPSSATNGSSILRAFPVATHHRGDLASIGEPFHEGGIRQASPRLVRLQAICSELLRHFWGCIDNAASFPRAEKLRNAILAQKNVVDQLKPNLQPHEASACPALVETLDRALAKYDRVLSQRKKKRPAAPGRRPAAPVRRRVA